MESKLDIHGTKCVHCSVGHGGAINNCPKVALQSTSVNHGWLCEKHYWAVKLGRRTK